MNKSTAGSARLRAQLTDIGFVAPLVILERIAQLCMAGGHPSARDRKELARMSSEKLVAGWQSWMAMSQRTLELNMAAASAGFAFWMPWTFTAPPPPTLQDSFVELATVGTEPYRRAVLENRRRLKRRSRT